jgi:aminoglycoside phosphotransferase (APT) family kinase protein
VGRRARPLPHGYTNTTPLVGGRIVKRYLGSDAAERMRNEADAILRTAGRVPAPAVVDADETACTLTLTRLPGRHGQELIDEGFGDEVLEAAGRTLRALHPDPEAATWTHGDYGPQNLLYDEATFEVTGVLDWEFARPGLAVSDLAWAEWIVRMHHPHAVASLPRLFRGWGDEPSWVSRRAAMLEACERFLVRAERMDDRRAAELWSHRRALAASWVG